MTTKRANKIHGKEVQLFKMLNAVNRAQSILISMISNYGTSVNEDQLAKVEADFFRKVNIFKNCVERFDDNYMRNEDDWAELELMAQKEMR